MERLRPLLRKLFAASPAIESWSTTKTADEVFRRDRNWREARPDERRSILEEYTMEKRRKEEVSTQETALTSGIRSRAANTKHSTPWHTYPIPRYQRVDPVASGTQYYTRI